MSRCRGLIDDELFSNSEICVCCNVQFGYEDTGINSVRNFRENWIKNGAKFNIRHIQPKNWNFEEQLESIDNKWK